MKFYEVLTECKRNGKGYCVSNDGRFWCDVYYFNEEQDGKLYTTTLIDSMRGLKGRQLSLVYYTADSTDKLMRIRDYAYIPTAKELWRYFLDTVKNAANFKYSQAMFEKWTKEAVKRHLITKEDAKVFMEEHDAIAINNS